MYVCWGAGNIRTYIITVCDLRDITYGELNIMPSI